MTRAPIVKQPDNPFHGRVSVGRAPNCDMVITDASVSKLHAHFMAIGADSADLVDRDSVNGTTLNGTPVTSDPVRVAPGDSITFGDTRAEFVDASWLWDLL